MCVLVKICAIFFLITPSIVGQTTGSVHRKLTETSTVDSLEGTVTGSSTFNTENTETYTVSSSEETDTRNTGSSTFSTENIDTSTVSSSEETDTTNTASSNFITENTETSTVRTSEETDTTITGSSTFTADNSETSALTPSEETDTTVEDSDYLTKYVFPITPVRGYLRQRFFRSTGNVDLETGSTSDTTTSDTTIEFTSTTTSAAPTSEDTTTSHTATEFTSTTISAAPTSEDTTTSHTATEFTSTTISAAPTSEDTTTSHTATEFTSTTISAAPTSEDTTTSHTSTEFTSTTISAAPTSEDTTTPDSTSEYTSTTVSSTPSICEGPINVDDLTINIKPSNTSFDVSWNLSNSECFVYNITLNDKTISTTDLFAHIDGLVPCTLYTVIVEVYHNDELKDSVPVEESTLPATDEHAQVKDLKITSESFALHVTWKKPYNCDKYTYNISWGAGTGESRIDNYIIEDLDPCTVYRVTVATVLDESITAQVSESQSTSIIIPGSVEDLNVDDNKDYINITWSEPKQSKNCVDNYRYEVKHNGNTVIESLTKDTYLVIYNPDPCVKHTYIVSAEGSSGVSDSRNKPYDKVKVNNPPEHFRNEFKDNLVITKWTIGKKECNPDKFYVKCSNPTEQSDIIEEGFKSQDMFIAHFYDLKNPYTNYSCCGMFENIKGNSSCGIASIQTEAKEPNSPSNLIVTVTKQNILNIKWDEPSLWNGDPEQYSITIEYLQSTYYVLDGCTEPTDKFSKLNSFKDTAVVTDPLECSAEYKISVSAKSNGGWGTVTEKNITTLSGIPEPISGLKCFLNINRDYNYEANVTVTWKAPCKSNGPLQYFEILLCRRRKNSSYYNICVHYNSNVTNMSEYERVFNSLEAEYDYELIISVHNHEYKSNPETCSFATPAGVPKQPTGENMFKMEESIKTTTAEIYINSNMFSSDMGIIRHYAIIVAEKGCEEDPKDGLFDPKNWPVISSNCYFQDKVKAYQATANYWNPFINKDVKNKTFTLGEDVTCGNTNVPCNRPLTPGTNYTVKIRGFTKYGYSDTTFVYFATVSESTDSGVDVGLIVGIIVGILAIAFLIAGALFYKNGRIFIKNWPRMDSESQISPTPLPVSIKKFDSHYRKMSENSGKIRSEFQLLSTISSDVTLSTKKASLPDNKKKNRYINILPYDETRVILNVTNSSSSDYINASYIQGYSGNSEYIAAQGPTEATCPAFWQMILEQNVRVIVMLTQCVENGKDKCYKYFPTVVEEYDLNNDIKIECIEEQLFTVYNRRTFKVVKNNVAKKIIHLQFNLWPDFDVPNDVSKMIEFYETVKEINMKKPSLILVHCSAGVGRTGTLIAIDILTQNIRDKRKVDIFGTVLNLRKQRMTMVQSERQYEFLFKCVHYIITKNGNMSNDRISESNM